MTNEIIIDADRLERLCSRVIQPASGQMVADSRDVAGAVEQFTRQLCGEPLKRLLTEAAV